MTIIEDQSVTRQQALIQRLDGLNFAGISEESLARKAGIESAEFDAWFEGLERFSGGRERFDEITYKVSEIAAATEIRFGVGPADPVQTGVLALIMDAFKRARDMREIILIDAPPGIGKTEAMKACVQDSPPERPVWTLTLRELELATDHVMWRIGSMTGAVPIRDGRTGKQTYGFEEVFQATHNRGGLLIVDETNLLADVRGNRGLRTLNVLRSFTDAGAFGIAMLGNGEVWERLNQGNKYGQLLSRVSAGRLKIAGLNAAPRGKPQLTAADVHMVMDAWRIKPDDHDVRSLGLSLAERPGALRTMTKAFRHALVQYKKISVTTLREFLPANAG